MTDTERDDEMVPRLLEFKGFCDKLVARAFVDEVPAPASSRPQASSSRAPAAPPPEPAIQTNRDFIYGLTDAFQAGFKARRIKPAEMIAKHMDKAMRRGQKGKQDQDFTAELDEVLALYRYTDDLDVFRTFYQRALAKRLLLGRSASDDIEKAVLKKLKGGATVFFSDTFAFSTTPQTMIRSSGWENRCSRISLFRVKRWSSSTH